MSTLATGICVPCRGGVPPLKGENLQTFMRQLESGWELVDEHRLEKEYSFEGFRNAFEFVKRVGEMSEEQGHHGDIYLAWGKVIIYILPLVAGPILMLFMIKPIFARRVCRERRVSLIRDNEPRLFAFVDAVCEAVGAVKPKRIDIDCDVNASAGFRRGLLSLFGRDLVLTIGMPLVAGLTLRQFAGVLAHEFGHFTQAVSMRLTFIIHRINSWFARVAYERDSWDEKLLEWQNNANDWLVIIFLVSRLLVWVSRLTLRFLLHVAHALGPSPRFIPVSTLHRPRFATQRRAERSPGVA